MKKKPFVYIMSPYTKGDPCINARFQCQVFDQMLTDEIVIPFAPLISHFQHTMFPRHYQDWIDYDLAIIPRFDAGIRLNVIYSAPKHNFDYAQSESSGADGEEAEFARLEIPTFRSVHALYAWAERDWNG